MDNQLKSNAYLAYGGWNESPYLGYLSPALALNGLIVAITNRKKATGTIYESHFIWVFHTNAIFFGFLCIGALPYIVAVLTLYGIIEQKIPVIMPMIKLIFPLLFLVPIGLLYAWAKKRMSKGLALLSANLPI